MMAANQANLYPHECLLDCVVNAVLAARSGLHVLLEGPSGCGLSAIAQFVASFCLKTAKPDQPWPKEIPRVLLGPESTIENLIGAFRPQPLMQGEDLTHLVQWENGPLLTAALNGLPVILDRINIAKAQVTERMNPILEKNARFEGSSFLVPEMGKSKEQPVAPGFVVIATLSIDPNRNSEAVSLALRNRFVTIAVEAPVLNESLKLSIARAGIMRSGIQLDRLANSERPPWAEARSLDEDDAAGLSLSVAGAFSLEAANDCDHTIRGLILLSDACCRVFDMIPSQNHSEHVDVCRLRHEALAFQATETLVERTLKDPVPDQRFFYRGDTKSAMFRTIAALSVASGIGRPLFLQGAPGCGKTEGVRHFSSHRRFHARTPVYSVSCSDETSTEQFLGSQVFEKSGFRFVEGPLVRAAREGCVFLADEFNLLYSNVMMALVPFLEARPGDSFLHPEVRDEITVAPGFLFVATGNDDTEKGRVRIPDLVMYQLLRLHVTNPAPVGTGCRPRAATALRPVSRSVRSP
jgi:MoxR-like ATPase